MIEFAELKIDALLVSALPNIRYLCGFTGSNGMLLVLPDAEAILFTDPRYRIQAAQESDCRVKVGTGPLLDHVQPILRKRKSRDSLRIAAPAEYDCA